MEYLGFLLDWRVIIIAAFALSGLYVHFRGAVRHKFSRQLTDHSTFLAPINAPLYLFSSIKNQPYPERSAFPELDVLKDNWEVIRDEGMMLYSDGAIKGEGVDPDAGFHSFFRNGWKRYYLKWYGEPHASAVKTCPKSVDLLQTIPGIKAAMFATLPPGGFLGAHRDPYAGSLRYHLGLVTPNEDDCNIVVDGQPYSWRDGEDIIFDETFIHHARNDTDKNRLILFCDLERPTNNPITRWYNKLMSRIIMSASATSNEPGERVGAINKLFSYIYPIRLKFKALKKYNRTLYYVVKWVLMGGGLLALFLLPNM